MTTMSGPGPSFVVDGFDDLREIGRGGSATVYAARQAELRRPVAIKVLHVELGDTAARRRFERECSVLGALGDAPGIVPVYATAYTSDGRGCIVMRLMRESLADMLQREGPLSFDQVRAIGLSATAALGHSHARGVVHRDVKPANLLISDFGEFALGDFDIASLGTMTSTTVTHDSMSPPHAPPERHRGESSGGPSGDIWSLGSTLYTLLAGRQPFGSATSEGGMAGLIERVSNDAVPPIGRDDVPRELEAVLRRAMAKDPIDRWPDMASMGAALAAVPVLPDRTSGPAVVRRTVVVDPAAVVPTPTVRPVPVRPSAPVTRPRVRAVGPSRVVHLTTSAVIAVVVLAAIALAIRLAIGW